MIKAGTGNKRKRVWSIVIIVMLFYFIGKSCGSSDENTTSDIDITPTGTVSLEDDDSQIEDSSDEEITSEDTEDAEALDETADDFTEDPTESQTDVNNQDTSADTFDYNGKSYTIIEVSGDDLSGDRKSNVAVDVGYGDRVYWALTNEYGQLIHVIADIIILQDEENEPVTSDGRYYEDEAKVSGVEREDLDEGHVIADSLGGVSNAYNITPQNSTLNRYGDQAYMEKVIRDVGGCEYFVATITYPDTTTQIPSTYRYEYILNGQKIVDEFDNVNPDEVNEALITEIPSTDGSGTGESSFDEAEELSRIDTNGNGKVTISEAKAAGYNMPIYSDEWLYKYMTDSDGDGMVGE